MSRVEFVVANVGVLVLLLSGSGPLLGLEPLFDAPEYYGAGDYPQSVIAADLDGDTDLDLAVSNRLSNNVSVLMNNGDGTFQSAVDYGAGADPVSVFAADLDGDTDIDLIAANYYADNVAVLLNLTISPCLCGDADNSGAIDIDEAVDKLPF